VRRAIRHERRRVPFPKRLFRRRLCFRVTPPLPLPPFPLRLCLRRGIYRGRHRNEIGVRWLRIIATAPLQRPADLLRIIGRHLCDIITVVDVNFPAAGLVYCAEIGTVCTDAGLICARLTRSSGRLRVQDGLKTRKKKNELYDLYRSRWYLVADCSDSFSFCKVRRRIVIIFSPILYNLIYYI